MARKKLDPKAPLRVKRIAVTGLFGLYNHDIQLHLEDRVTILHGPNGVGKTALLKLLAGLFSGQYRDFAKYQFARLVVELTDGSSVIVQPLDKPRGRERNAASLRISHEIAGKPPRAVEIFPTRSEVEIYNEMYGSIILHPRKDFSIKPARFYGGNVSVPDAEEAWLIELRQRVQVHLIETQRLLRMSPKDSARQTNKESTFLPAVHDYAKDLSSRIKDVLARYGTESQLLDQTFPQRLLKAVNTASMSPDELKRRMAELNQQRAKLQEIGLLDPASAGPFDVASLDELEPEKSAVMQLYVEDTEKKLGVLEPLARRITLLLENVNQKFRHKSLRIEREKGFVALGHDGLQLDPDSLSSGEQHELVLLYDLLFQVGRGALVLIDEPELSLHVAWQKGFLPDLLEIARTAELDAIIATHSPFIVGDRSDLTVALSGDIGV